MFFFLLIFFKIKKKKKTLVSVKIKDRGTRDWSVGEIESFLLDPPHFTSSTQQRAGND